MIASLRGVLALAVIAVALAVIALAWGRTVDVAVDRSLVPGFVAPETLAWTRADGSTYTVAAKDPAANGVIAALRGARWHRDDATTRAGAITTTLVAGPNTIGIGQVLPGTEQQWIVVGGRARLVDAWVARALAPAPWQLRDAHPLAAESDGDLTIGLGPTRKPIGADGRSENIFVDEVRLAALRAALRGVAIVGPADAASDRAAPGAVRIITAKQTFVGGGTCTGGSVLAIDDDVVCASGWEALVAAVTALFDGDIADRRPSPFTPRTIDLVGGGTVLVKPGAATLDGGPADLAAVAELLAVLGTPAERIPAAPRGSSTMSLAVDARSISLYPPDVLVRADGVVLRVGTGAFAILARGKDAYRDPTLWREDPASIWRIEVDGVTHERAVVVGEWTTAGKPAAPAPALETLVTALAAPRALPATAPRDFATKHRVRLEVMSPASGSGAPIVYEVELGALVPAGCPLRHRGRSVIVAAAACP